MAAAARFGYGRCVAGASRSEERIAPELAERLRERDAVSVLIEADVPTPRAAVAQRPGKPGSNVLKARTLDAGEATEREARIEALHALLREVLGAEPRYFKYSNAFGATVTRAQLERIARSPLVRCVRENRTLRK